MVSFVIALPVLADDMAMAGAVAPMHAPAHDGGSGMASHTKHGWHLIVAVGIGTFVFIESLKEYRRRRTERSAKDVTPPTTTG